MSEQEQNKALTLAEQADRHILYQDAVQCTETEIEFFDTTYMKLKGKKPLVMKEDFCGTALLSVDWVNSDSQRSAIGVDICVDTLNWAKANNIKPAGKDIESRISLFQKDVCLVTEPKADITCALNFSFCIFKTRDLLRHYFESVLKGLNDDGILILDMFGGTECQDELEEETEMDDYPATYVWEHANFNPITNDITCHIHFDFDDDSRIEKAFTYNWRLWSLPEINELLTEAGFSKVRVYWEKFEESEDDEDELEGTGEYFEAIEVENQESWMVYIVAEK